MIPNAGPKNSSDLEKSRVTHGGARLLRSTSTSGASLSKMVRRDPINLAASQRTMRLRATTGRETGRPTMGDSRARLRSMAVPHTIALSHRMRHPPGPALEADVLMRLSSVTRAGTSR